MNALSRATCGTGGLGIVLGWGGIQQLVARRWVWIRMPEKRYLARITISREIVSGKKARARRRNIANWTSRIEMVDPIPNKLQDECYGETAKYESIAAAASGFAKGMIEDRCKYIGNARWRPDAARLARLWKTREQRRKDIGPSDADDQRAILAMIGADRTASELRQQMESIELLLVKYGVVTERAIACDGIQLALAHTLNGQYAESAKTRKLLPPRAFKHAVV